MIARSLVVLCAVALLPASARADDLALRGRLHTGQGAPLEDGVVLVRDGKVAAVGPFASTPLPEGTRVVTWPGAELSPGLIDARSTVGSADRAEHEREVVADLRVLDAVDLADRGFPRLAAQGVTTVCVGAGPESVIGGQARVVKTAGPASGRVLEAAGALDATFGNEAWSRGAFNRRPFGGGVDFTTRRPTTRMGLVWVFRDAFARAAAGDGAPQSEALREVLRGERVLRIQARRRGDIEMALRLTAEAGVPFVLEEATEAYEVLDLLAARDVPVVFGPLFDRPRGYRARTGEADAPCLRTPALLAERGLRFCLTANDREGEDGLRAQAMLAVRYGLDPQRALEAVTRAPADLLGGAAAARLGRLEPGRDADLVVWSGPPLAATTRPLLVLIAGVPVAGALPAPAADAPAPTPPGEKQRF